MSGVGASSVAVAVAVAVAGEHAAVRRAVELVGQILAGSVTSRTTLDGFLQASLGRSGSDLVCESRKLSSIGHVTVGLAIAALIDRFDPAIGPGDDDEPPTWGHVEIGEQHLAPPSALSAYFAAGQLAPARLVVRLIEAFAFSDPPRLQVYTAAGDRAHGVAVIEAIMADAEGAKNLFRGRALTATENNGLVLEVTELPVVTPPRDLARLRGRHGLRGPSQRCSSWRTQRDFLTVIRLSEYPVHRARLTPRVLVIVLADSPMACMRCANSTLDLSSALGRPMC